MEAFLLQLAAGIATGGIYASVALAIVMIVGVVMPLAWYNQRVASKAELERHT